MSASTVSTSRLVEASRMQADPLASMTPESVKYAHNAFRAGRLAPAAILWEAFEDFDDKCNPAADKAKSSAMFHGWDITLDDAADPVAIKHAEALKTFFNRIAATDATDLNKRGGMDVFTYNMLDAEGKGYSAQEIIWQRRGGHLSAEMRFVPLQFFENTTGKLRFIENPYSLEGVDLKPGHWVTHWGRKVMLPVTVCGMYKRFSLQDWLEFSLRFGSAAIVATCAAEPGAPDWIAMENAAAAAAAGGAAVIGDANALEALNFGSSGNMPYEAMIDHMDRAISTLWRGGDLSTMSSDTQGASVQGDETEILDNATIVRMNGTINEQVVTHAIKYMFGEYPRAWFQQKGAIKEDTELDIKIDDAFDRWGIPQNPESRCERYHRQMEDPGTGDIHVAPKADDADPQDIKDIKTISNQAKRDESDAPALLLAHALENDLQPIAQAISDIMGDTTKPLIPALNAFLQTEFLPLAEAALDTPESAAVLQQLYRDVMKGTS